jgi:hypothetical protein
MKTDWKIILEEARGFTRTVVNAQEKKKFDTAFRFNLTCLASEKYLVAYLDYIKYPAVTHSLGVLLADLMRKRELTDSLKDGLKRMNSYQNLCGGGELSIPPETEMPELISCLKELAAMAEAEINATEA